LARMASPLLVAVLGALLAVGSPLGAVQAAAGPPSFTANWPGGEAPAAPVLFAGSRTWDVSVHRSAPTEAMEPTLAQHGADCTGVPSTHLIDRLAEGVYVCGDHLMTSISDREHGQITLTPDQVVDLSRGPATIAFGVSTLRFDSGDWLTFWLSPWDENLVQPSTDTGDLPGPPRTAVRVTGAAGAANASRFTAQEVLDHAVSPDLPGSRVPLEQVMSTVANVRTEFELDVSRTHLRFGVPSLDLWWADADFPVPLPFDRAVFQMADESLDPCRGQPAGPCFPDTWHWSDVAMGPSTPFTMLQGDARAVTPAMPGVVRFAAPAPAGSYLRFEAMGGGVRAGFDGGPPRPALRQGPASRRPDGWASYWTPVPEGTTSVSFAADGDWWVRDPAIWSLAPPPADLPGPAPPRESLAPASRAPAGAAMPAAGPVALLAAAVAVGVAAAVLVRRRRNRFQRR
jgi:hypothetical protein